MGGNLFWLSLCLVLVSSCGIHGHGSSQTHGETERLPTSEEAHPTTAIVLTTISGMSAVLGGAIVVVVGVPNKVVLGHLLSFAAGVMLYVSYADMLPEAMRTTGWHAGFWFFAGAIGFMGLSSLLPEPEVSDFLADDDAGGKRPRGGSASAPVIEMDLDQSEQSKASGDDDESPTKTGSQVRQRRPRSSSRPGRRAVAAGQSSGSPRNGAGGSSDADIAKKDGHWVHQYFWLTVTDKLSARRSGKSAREWFGGGLTTAERRRAMVTGLIAALGIALHNLPEGLIVYTQAMPGMCSGPPEAGDGEQQEGDIGWGEVLLPGGLDRVIRRCSSRALVITLAIALHNIPEGMAVASPILASTGSAWEAMKWTVITSVFEPAAAILFGWAFGAQLTATVAANISAAVAGIMVVLCVQELVPSAAEHVQNGRAVALSNLVGQGLMWASLTFLVGQ